MHIVWTPVLLSILPQPCSTTRGFLKLVTTALKTKMSTRNEDQRKVTENVTNETYQAPAGRIGSAARVGSSFVVGCWTEDYQKQLFNFRVRVIQPIQAQL